MKLQSAPMAENWLATPKAAQLLGLSVRTLERHRQRRTGPVFSRLGRLIFYDLADLRRWRDDNKTV